MTNNFFITTAFNPNPTKTITAHFKNGTSAQYTIDIYNLLITDNDVECITDGETGEIIYTK